MSAAPIVIVGAGMAAYGVARELRKRDPQTALLLVTGDAGGAYAKPMLSNALALGRSAAQLQTHSAAQMAGQLNMTVLAHTRVLELDTTAHRIVTGAGPIGYRKLVLALGAEPIRLALKGDAAEQVLSVNHLDDYAELRARLDAAGAGARVTILGAGLIGCEFADDLAAAGHRVTLVDPNPLPLAALAAPALARALLAAWAGSAITLRLGTTANLVRRDGAALRVELADGSSVASDLVLSAVGLRPALALAQAAGLATRRGIMVDGFGQTSAADVYALGDCAEYSNGAVLPYVAPLMAAARAIGATLAGMATPIEIRNDAVLVKTPSCKLALSPPPTASLGAWTDATDAGRLVARFHDDQGRLRGYGLSQPTPALRAALQAELDR
ncbi:MAG: FAD-dependent oxidoreductase [Pseudomonadota bacterium]